MCDSVGATRMSRATIIPTGDEVLDGTVNDVNSPAIECALRAAFPDCEVVRAAPCRDRRDEILTSLNRALADGVDFVVLVGGTGGGGTCAPSLATDLTSETVAGRLPGAESTELRATNGHLLSRIVVGAEGRTTVLTVPGPHVEAVAAAQAAVDALMEGQTTPRALCRRIARAVLEQYPVPERNEP